ncbi:MAG: hypothetical protein ACFFD3_10175 [Candidatus Thorarchaeota archaeon]
MAESRWNNFLGGFLILISILMTLSVYSASFSFEILAIEQILVLIALWASLALPELLYGFRFLVRGTENAVKSVEDGTEDSSAFIAENPAEQQSLVVGKS